jgi:hypothetical protein
MFGAANPAANAFGWNNSNMSIPFTVADSLSGVQITSPSASPLVLTSEGTAVTRLGNLGFVRDHYRLSAVQDHS